VIKIKIINQSTFSRQLTLWINNLVVFIVGIFFIYLSWIGYEDKLSIYFLFLGLILLFISVIFFGSLIYEVMNPKESIIKCKLINVKNFTPFRFSDYFGFKVVIETDGVKKRLQLIHREKWIYNQWALNLLLNKGEEYSIKYLSISKLITEIENITYPELNSVIQTCFVDKRVSKKSRKRAFELLKQYSDRQK